jgi:taurine transport system substrate-binding protein
MRSDPMLSLSRSIAARCVSLLWLCVLTLSACSQATPPASDKPARLRIGYQSIPNAELIAKQLGWQEASLGVPIEWRQFENGRDVNTAIAAGGIDIGLSGSTGAATGLAQGLPYSVIAIHDVIGESEALAVRPAIHTVADLRGKKLAAPFGTTTHYSLLQLLHANQLGAGDVTLIDLAPSDTLAAWIRGDIDGAYVWQPTLQKLYDAGGTRLISSADMVHRGIATFDVAVASREVTTKYPELVAGYLRNLSRAVLLYRQDQPRALEALAKELNITVDQARAQATGLIWLTSEEQLAADYFGPADAPGGLSTALKTTADFLVSQRVIRTAPDLATFQRGTDAQFLRRAAGR